MLGRTDDAWMKARQPHLELQPPLIESIPFAWLNNHDYNSIVASEAVVGTEGLVCFGETLRESCECILLW